MSDARDRRGLMSNDLPNERTAVDRLLSQAKPGDIVHFSHTGCRLGAFRRTDGSFVVVCTTHELLLAERHFDVFALAMTHVAGSAARAVEASISRCRSCGVQLIVKSVSCDRCGEVVNTPDVDVERVIGGA